MWRTRVPSRYAHVHTSAVLRRIPGYPGTSSYNVPGSAPGDRSAAVPGTEHFQTLGVFAHHIDSQWKGLGFQVCCEFPTRFFKYANPGTYRGRCDFINL
eukprot:2823555-Rhodomonas_salina.1